MKRRRTKVAAALAMAGFEMITGGAAMAQDIRVEVTGSNIKRADTETAAPIEVITREDIQASGLQTISDVLRQITANNNGSISPSFFNGFAKSSSAVSLRGLGANNTLVLLNGRRLANFGFADDSQRSFVDLQQIPFDAVERIEVLKDGASAIYGSDAVAGVVNIILRQQFTGVAVTGTAGTNYNGTGNQYKGAFTIGKGDLIADRYNAFLTIDAQKQEAIPMNKGRQYIGTNNLTFMGLDDMRQGNPFSGFGSSSLLGNVRPVAASDPNGTPGPYRSLPGNCAAANQDGSFCRWDVKDYTDMQPQIERFNAFAHGAYNFGNSIQGYADVSLFQVTTETRNRPIGSRFTWYDPATMSVVSSLNIYLPVGHPDNPFSANNQVARLYYADGALGSVHENIETNTQRYLAGVKGNTEGWDWDAAALYIRSDTKSEFDHVYSYSRLLQGLAGTGPYGYYRIGASASLNNPAIYSWIAPERSYTVVSDNTVFDAKASRDLYPLAGGPMALAVGYEFRREALSNPGIPGTETGDVFATSYIAAAGSRTVNAVYAELYAPLLTNLEMTAAVRADDYSDFGTTTNPKVGIKWAVVPQLVMRGTYESAFRAPGLYEIKPSVLTGQANEVDPVRCPVTGLPVDCNALFQGLVSGNPNLRPETSTMYTAGLILEPIRGLSGTLDYWNIKTKNQITVADYQAILNNPSAYPTSTIVRDTNNLPGIPNSGSLVYVTTPWTNANNVKTDGIDLDVVWKLRPQAWGALTTEFQWTHIFNFTQTFTDGQTFNYVGTQGNYGVSSGAGTPADRMNLIIGWNRGPWNLTGTVRYISDYQSIGWTGEEAVDGCLSPEDKPPACHVSSFTTLDLSASYSGFENWQIFGSIINVFNRIAPFNPAAAYGGVNFNYNYAFSGATGTQFNLGARYTFR
jgi:iron complex outermembrane recepter protein